MKSMIICALLILSTSNKVYAVSESIAREFCREWFPALVLGPRDVGNAVEDLLDGFYAENPTLIDPNFSKPQVGRFAVSQYYSSVMVNYPNWAFTIEEIIPREDGFVLHYIGNAPGVVDSFRGVDIIDLIKVDGKYKIKKLIGIFDRTPFIEAGEQD